MFEATTRRDRIASFFGALLFHAGLFYIGGKALAQPAEYGIDPGSGGMDIDLIAGPSDAAGATPHASEAPMTVSSEEASVLPEPAPAAPPPASLVGEGHSAEQGTDPITFHSEGGGYRNGNPTHLRNPAPRYPIEARRLGQQGLVVLVVQVDRAGRPTSVELKQRSGFPLLDESALTAVRRWTFRPAWIGGMTVESIVEVPIRFVLSDQDHAS